MYCYEQNSMKEITALFVHEVKNPVSLIKANIELLELDEGFSLYEKNFNIIKKELNKITNIITDFMSLFKPTDTINLKNISLLEILQESIEDFSTSTQKYNINFSLECFCNFQETFILADYSKLSILFLNIYKNAVESIGSLGDVKTKVYTNKNTLVIDIIDNGSGIPEKIQNYVGTPFFTSKPNGSGLGLSICKAIVKELNGNFKIFNNVDKGCTVRISFNL